MIDNKFGYAKQYPFKREDFTDAFHEVFNIDNFETLLDLFDSYTCAVVDNDFLLKRVDDKFYIFHLKSMTGINWYKHLGRTNTCTRDDLTKDDLIKFLKFLHDAMVSDKLIKDGLYFVMEDSEND